MQRSQGNCKVPILLSASMPCRIDHYTFANFIISIALDLALAHLGYRHSAEIDWFFVDGMPRRFPYRFADDRSCSVVKAR